MKIIFKALIPVHKLKFYHGDLKIDNLILKNDDEIDSLKVVDFGFYNFFKSKFEQVSYFMAPEQIVKYHPETEKIDLWACGSLLYFLLSGVPPFYDANGNASKIEELIVKGTYDVRSGIWGQVSYEAKDLIK